MKVKEESEKVGLKLNIQKMIMASSPIASWQTEGEKVEAVTDFLGLQYHCQWWVQPWDEKMIASWKENYYNLRQRIKKQSRHFADIGLHNQMYSFSSSRVWMWELNHKKVWALKN